LKINEYEKFKLKGLDKPISLYLVKGMKNVLDDNKRINENFKKRFDNLDSIIDIPDDLILPTEVIDGSLGHSKITAVISYGIASMMGLSESEKKDIVTAAFLQDVGKIAISHHITARKGVLDDLEYKEMAKHVEESITFTKMNGFDNPNVINIIRHHHDNYAINKDKMPLGARITAVADCYSALTSWRPYRESWDRSAALNVIKREADNGKFDKDVVNVAVEILS